MNSPRSIAFRPKNINTDQDAIRAAARNRAPGRFFFLLLIFAELGLGLFWFKGWSSPPILAFSHGLILALMGVLWRYDKGQNLQFAPIAFMAVLFAGPLGAAGALLLAGIMKLQRPDRILLDEWYQRLTLSTRRDEENRLYRSIKSGRASKSRSNNHDEKSGSSVSSFEEIIQRGDLGQKQGLLGIIALKYHPDFFPVLKTALRDTDPTVRVQAAAVYAKLQMHYKTRFAKAWAQNPKDQKQQQERIRELRECELSKFLDKAGLGRALLAIEQHEAIHVISPVA